MLDPYVYDKPSTDDPVGKFEAEVKGLEQRCKKRYVVFRVVMVFVWLLVLAIGFGLGAFWKH